MNGGEIKLENFSVCTYTLLVITWNESLDGSIQVVSLLLMICIYLCSFSSLALIFADVIFLAKYLWPII